MHTIFSVASKLLGVYFTFLGIIYLVNVILVGDGLREATLLQVVHAGLSFVFLTHLGSALHAVWIDRTPARIVIEAVPLMVAIFVVIRADRVVDWISREKTPVL